MQSGLNEFAFREKESDFDSAVFGRIGTMDDVFAFAVGKELADRTRLGIFRVSCADEFAKLGYRIVPLEGDRHTRTAGHELDETVIKRPTLVHCVKCARSVFRESNLLYRKNLEAGLLNARENFALQVFLDAIRFKNCECAFNAHIVSSREECPPEVDQPLAERVKSEEQLASLLNPPALHHFVRVCFCTFLFPLVEETDVRAVRRGIGHIDLNAQGHGH